MKRSEMIDIMCEAYAKTRGVSHHSLLKKAYWEREMNAVLTAIEEAGILPECRLCATESHGDFPQEELCEHEWETEE
jgi:hypothetical protein